MRISPQIKRLLHQAGFAEGAAVASYPDRTVRAAVKHGLVKLEWRAALRAGPDGKHAPVRVAYITEAGRESMKAKANDTTKPPLRDQVIGLKSEVEGLRGRLARATKAVEQMASVLRDAERAAFNQADMALFKRIRDTLAANGFTPSPAKSANEALKAVSAGGAQPSGRAVLAQDPEQPRRKGYDPRRWDYPAGYRTQMVPGTDQRWVQLIGPDFMSIASYDREDPNWREQMQRDCDAHAGRTS